MLKIFYVRRLNDSAKLVFYNGFIVVAENEEEACHTYPNVGGYTWNEDECSWISPTGDRPYPDEWVPPEELIATEWGTAKPGLEKGVLYADFNN